MTWCCDFAKSSFMSRYTYGEFLVAGIDPQSGKLVFLNGFNMCHRKDYSNVIAAIQRAKQAIEAEGISNFKLSLRGAIHYCKQCGANFKAHYGADGGLLRDDEYLQDLSMI